MTGIYVPTGIPEGTTVQQYFRDFAAAVIRQYAATWSNNSAERDHALDYATAIEQGAVNLP